MGKKKASGGDKETKEKERALKLLQKEAQAAVKQAEKNLKEATAFQKKLGSIKDPASLEIEMPKFDRLIKRRQQMFDMLRKTIQTYDETAKGIIEAISR